MNDFKNYDQNKMIIREFCQSDGKNNNLTKLPIEIQTIFVKYAN